MLQLIRYACFNSIKILLLLLTDLQERLIKRKLVEIDCDYGKRITNICLHLVLSMPEPTDFEPCLLVLSLACVIAPKLLSFKSNKYYLAVLPSSDVCRPVSC